MNKKGREQDYGKVRGGTSITVHSLDRGRVWNIIREVTCFRNNNLIDIRSNGIKTTAQNYIIVSKLSCISL